MYNSLQISAHREGEQGRLIWSSCVCRLLLPWLGAGPLRLRIWEPRFLEEKIQVDRIMSET